MPSQITPRSQSIEANTFDYTGHIKSPQETTYYVNPCAGFKMLVTNVYFETIGEEGEIEVEVYSTAGEFTQLNLNGADSVSEAPDTPQMAILDPGDALYFVLPHVEGDLELTFTITCVQLQA